MTALGYYLGVAAGLVFGVAVLLAACDRRGAR